MRESLLCLIELRDMKFSTGSKGQAKHREEDATNSLAHGEN